MAKKRFPIDNPEEFRARLKLAREMAGLKQGEAAEALGLDQGSISEWETGKVEPSPGALVKLAALYGVSIDWLLTGEEHHRALVAANESSPTAPQWFSDLGPRISALDEKGQAAVKNSIDLMLGVVEPPASHESANSPPRKAAAGPARARRR